MAPELVGKPSFEHLESNLYLHCVPIKKAVLLLLGKGAPE